MVQFKSTLKSANGLKELDDWLRTRSYIEGFVPTDVDQTIVDQLSGAPSAADFPHALRWYNHIRSFSADERKKEFGKAGSVPSTSTALADTVAKSEEKGGGDDDFDLFGDEDEEDDAEKERIKQERLKAYEEKKSKKPEIIAKSSIILDIKPWDDECDLKEMERRVREINCDGLIWSQQAKILPVAFGVCKLQIGCVVEDDKVSVDFLEESITAIEDLVQSVDIVAFNKI